MKNIFQLAIIIFASSLSVGYAQQKKIYDYNKNYLLIEAEDYNNQTKDEERKWENINEQFTGNSLENSNESIKTASNNKFIQILPDTRISHDDKLIKGINFSDQPGELAIVNYVVEINRPGRYYVWARALSTGTEDNGVHVGIDGTWPESGKRMQLCEGKNSVLWESKQRTQEVHCGVPYQIYLDIEKPGIHEIQFSMREDGFKMDQWLITTDKDYNPRNDPKFSNAQRQETNNVNSFMDLVKTKVKDGVVISALDFNIIDNGFYIDNNWLTINPNKNKKAEASIKYHGKSELYDVVIFGVGENDGRSKYSFLVNNFPQGSFSPPLSTAPFEEGPLYAQSFSDVQINNNELITIIGEIGSRDGKEYSRARWNGVAIVQIGQGENLLQSIQASTATNSKVAKSGEFKKWHKVTFTFDGPETSEDDEYNPFFNYRLNVTFTHQQSGKNYVVPGYFAADGEAGETSAIKGNKWRVHFAPDETGIWKYSVDFRRGRWVAVSDRNNPGDSGGYMDGATGIFTIENSDKTGRDFRGKGRLQYVGERYLKFAETGEYFLKVGSDAPENFLSYADFDGTFHNDGHKDNMVKTWKAHLKDWKEGDPTWKGGKGKAIIGAVNYLASKGLNAFSFLTNNIQGDDQNVFPYVDYNNWDRFDVSKLDQWEIVFEHADKLGMFLHFKTLEMENQGLLDNGGVGAKSKLYYRELIARFGHHLALNWNMGEENGDWVKNHLTPPQFTNERLSMAAYFYEHDPYHHHVVIHNGNPFTDLLGPNSKYTGPSIQTHLVDFRMIHKEVLHWIEASKKAGKLWAVAVDEPGDAQHSLVPDADDPDHDNARRNGLWGTFMAGGWGTEWYFGYKHEHSDLTCEDYSSRDLFWNQGKIALKFFKDNNIPFWEMENKNSLVGNAENENSVYCFAKENQLYLVYLNSVETASIDLTNVSGNFTIHWFNPKKGGALQQTKIKKTKGGGITALGSSPDKNQGDWIIMVSKI